MTTNDVFQPVEALRDALRAYMAYYQISESVARERIRAVFIATPTLVQTDDVAEPDEITMSPCESSLVAAFGWHGPSGALAVQLHSGHVYRYSAVPAEVYAGMSGAPSIGRFWIANLKGKYGERRQ